MVGGDEVQDETQSQMLTNEELEEIKEEVDKKESDFFVAELIKRTVGTIVMEELYETDKKMNRFRNVLAQGMLAFAQNHTEDTAKLERFVDAFRTSWKVYKENEDEKNVLDVFMNEMNNELWTSPDSKDKEV